MQEKQGAVLRRHSVHHQRFPAQGVGFPEHLPHSNAAENGAITPQVNVFDVHHALKHHTHFLGHAPGTENGFSLLVRCLTAAGACQHMFLLFVRQACQQGRSYLFHKYSFRC